MIHTPGHTAGSISVLAGGGEAIVGDVIMGGHLGGEIRPAWPHLHYFGHGGPLALSDVARVFGHHVEADSRESQQASLQSVSQP